MVALLERFPGYTLTTLREEDAELLHLVRLADREREVRERERDQDSGAYAEFG